TGFELPKLRASCQVQDIKPSVIRANVDASTRNCRRRIDACTCRKGPQAFTRFGVEAVYQLVATAEDHFAVSQCRRGIKWELPLLVFIAPDKLARLKIDA